jgi:hypothetical protein
LRIDSLLTIRLEILESRGGIAVFHVTVAALCDQGRGLNFHKEVQMSKVGLLYGDRITIVNPLISNVYKSARYAEGGRDGSWEDRLNLFEYVYSSANGDRYGAQEKCEQIQGRIIELRELIKRPTLSRREKELRRKHQKFFVKAWRNLAEHFMSLEKESGLTELSPAIEAGIVELASIDGNPEGDDSDNRETLTSQFVDAVNDSVTDECSYPFLDKYTGKLVSAGLKEGNLDFDAGKRSKARHLGIAANLLERLPVLDRASISEILDVRIELDRYLDRFRGAVQEFSDDVREEVWTEGFIHEADTVFLRDVQPAIQDIEDAIKGNKYSNALCSRFTSGLGPWAGPTVSIAMGPMDTLASLILGLGSLGLTFADAYNQWEKQQTKIEANKLFFYYRAQQA